MTAADDDDIKTFRVIHGVAPGLREAERKGAAIIRQRSG
jgi:hypothetical protein